MRKIETRLEFQCSPAKVGPLKLYYTEDRAQWPPVVRNMSQRCFQLLKGEFSEARWCIFPEGKLISMKTVTAWWNPLTWSEFQKKKKICDKSVSGEDSTWGLMRVKPITYLYSNLAADWSTIKVGESLQNNLIEMFCSTAHSLKFSALRLVARSGGGGDWFLKLLDGILLEMYKSYVGSITTYFCRVHLENRINSFSIMFSMSQKLEKKSVSPSMSLKMGYDSSEGWHTYYRTYHCKRNWYILFPKTGNNRFPHST